MARAHRVLAASGWSGSDLRGLIEAEAPTGLADRFQIAGPTIKIPALLVQPFALIVHELMANAVTHGALCGENGSIAITWTVSANNCVELAWRETGENEAAQENFENTGIGLQLVKSLVEQQLAGQMSSSRTARGLNLSFVIPLG